MKVVMKKIMYKLFFYLINQVYPNILEYKDIDKEQQRDSKCILF